MNLNWKEFVEQTLLNGTQYTGNKEPGVRQFSGSMISNTQLQNYLKYMNGSTKDKIFGQNTAGSIFHLGAELIFDNSENYAQTDEQQFIDTELSLKYELSNGWIISGQLDLVLHSYDKIVDWKNTTATTITKARKEGRNNGYAMQQAVYRFLVQRVLDKNYSCALGFIDKGHSHYKDNKNQCLELMDIETYPPDEIEQILLEKTNQLQEYIDLDQEPPECTENEKWVYIRKGKPKRYMACSYYCDQNVNCQYYTNYYATKAILHDL